MSDLKLLLDSFIHDLSDIPSNDMLVSIDLESKKVVQLIDFDFTPFTLSNEGTIKSVFKTASDSIRETDVNPLCICDSYIKWNKNEQEFKTPLLLHPVEAKLKKLTNELTFSISDEWEINPYFKWLWKDWTETDFPTFDSRNEVLQFITNEIEKQTLPISIENSQFIGNFHYHRFHVLRELEGIRKQNLFSNPLKQVLGETVTENISSSFTKYNLLSTDKDQLSVLKALESQNCVLEGPPGTGKTQVIVNLIGKILDSKETVLLVSEKKVALDVILKKLSDIDLGHFAVSISSQTSKADFIKKLKSTWTYLEQVEEQNEKNFFLSENYKDNLALLIHRLRDSSTFQGVDFATFQDFLKEHPHEPKNFSTQVCTLKEWIELKDEVMKLEENIGSLSLIRNFKHSFYQLEHPDRLINELIERLEKIKKFFQIQGFLDVRKLNEKVGRAQLLENDLFIHYSSFIGKPKLYKTFENKVRDLKIVQDKLDESTKENSIWKAIPTQTQLTSWKNATSFFQKRKAKSSVSKLLKDSSVLFENALITLEKLYSLLKESDELKSYFSENNFSSNLLDLQLEHQFLKSLLNENPSVLNELVSWKKEDRKALIELSSDIEFVLKKSERYFFINEESNLSDILIASSKVIQQIYPFWFQLKQIPSSIYSSLEFCSNSTEMEAFIVHSNWKIIQANFPELVKFKPSDFSNKLETILTELETEQKWFATALRQTQVKKFHLFEQLLLSNTAKLSANDKERKKTLKKGKALLVNEFSKSKSHKSIRELLASDAKEWIACLLPVWLSTTTQIADNFPLESELFDWTIFDEASQIPLPNAVGSLARSRRYMVAGDQHQMSPSSYFGKNYSFPNLMQQSAFYSEKHFLSYHYRSSHPDLISFSNSYFYENRLHVFPSTKMSEVISFHSIENGRFIERKNEQEAKSIAEFLESFNWKKSIGLVAFSEEQLNCILDACSPKVLENLDKQQEQNRGFVKSLEKVQGDEADCLVISFGYAKNASGEFANRFGPVNQAEGHKRLNVLFSRAKEKIEFFASVSSSDFQLSENESVNLLRKWFLFCENADRKSNNLKIPFKLEFTTEGNKIAIKNASSTIESAEDLLTFHQIMSFRNWKINYI
ncbi:MAG: DEAD/DEAH box helicase [Fluviicola sp.]